MSVSWSAWREAGCRAAAKRASAHAAAAHLALQLVHAAFDAWLLNCAQAAAERSGLQLAVGQHRRWLLMQVLACLQISVWFDRAFNNLRVPRVCNISGPSCAVANSRSALYVSYLASSHAATHHMYLGSILRKLICRPSGRCAATPQGKRLPASRWHMHLRISAERSWKQPLQR